MALSELTILALVAALAWGAVSDALWFRIPNAVPLVIAAVYPLYLFAAGKGIDAGLWALLVATGVFLLGFLLFARGAMGGGDVKLLTALSLWAGPHYFPSLILTIALAGGGLALAILLVGRLPRLAMASAQLRATLRLPPAPSSIKGGRTIPYAIAIAAGGLMLAHQLARTLAT
jgi:prepilin peptidase CpaA